jgi:hypothetical protein
MQLKNTLTLILTILLVIAVHAGCKGKPEREPPATNATETADEGTEDKTFPVEGTDYFIYNYGDWGGKMGYIEPEAEGNYTLNITDASTIDTVVSFGFPSRTRLLISPDASKLLSQETISSIKEIPFRLTDRVAGKELWKASIKGKGEDWTTRVEKIWWDLEMNHLVVECKAISRIMGRTAYQERTMPHLWWFITLDLATGEQIGHLDLIDENATGRTKTENLSGAQYAAGNLYLVLPDYPITDFEAYENIREKNTFNIYAIDPITGDSRMIDMKGLLGRPSIANYFILPDGTKIIAQTEDYLDDGTPRPMGGSIYEIDTASGEWVPLFKADKENAYNLHSATPDGNTICYTNYLFRIDPANRSAGFETSHMVKNLNDERTWELPVKSTLYNFWLSPSGNYIVSLNLIKGSELSIITIDSGEQKFIARGSDAGSPAPIGFLGGLGNNI